MTDSVPRAQKPTDNRRTAPEPRPAPDAITAADLDARTDERHRVGVDAAGRAHYWAPALGVAWVVVDGTPTYAGQPADARTYVRYVAREVGWDWHRYDDRPFAEWAADALGVDG